jgi:hypothetical protein
VKDERLVVLDREELGQVWLGRPDVDVGVAVVAKDPKAAIEVEVDRRGLEILRVIRPDDDPTALDLAPDVAVRQDGHSVLR